MDAMLPDMPANRHIGTAVAASVAGLILGALGMYMLGGKESQMPNNPDSNTHENTASSTVASTSTISVGEWGGERVLTGPDTISGKYTSSSAHAHLTIERLRNNIYKVTGTALRGQNDGVVNGVVLINQYMKAQYAEGVGYFDAYGDYYGCVIDFDFSETGKITATELVMSGGCGGVGVSFTGEYEKE